MSTEVDHAVPSLIVRDLMPHPTYEEPFAQVEWVFDSVAALQSTKSSADNYRNAKAHFIRFVREEQGIQYHEPYSVDQNFDEYTLIRFKSYVDDQALSSHSRATILSSARVTIQKAIDNKWIALKRFVDFSLDPRGRETNDRDPYTEAETRSIVKALHRDIQFARGLLKPYRRTGLGRPPVLERTRSGTRYERGWWKEEDNLRWYFENKLDCQPITSVSREIAPSGQPVARSFLQAATSQHGGLHNLYRRWGVTAWIGPEIILPFCFRLVEITGLNPTVALALRTDSFSLEHPLTKRPYLRFWKQRGRGELDLHVDSLRRDAVALDSDQARTIERIFHDVENLTAGFRDELPEESRDHLFIYQSRAAADPGRPRHFLKDIKKYHNWANEFVERHGIRGQDGQPLKLTLSRFRPSLVSRLVKRNVDISHIQAILGHASILTTLRYLDGHDFHPAARAEVNRSLTRIRENVREYKQNPQPVFGADATESSQDETSVVFPTGIALCKNVFRPPNNIRTAAGIPPGTPCTLFNMCLRCPNVLITEEHLPYLFALRRQYLVAVDQGITATTHRGAVRQNLSILENLLDPATSDWSDSVLRDAEAKSETIDLGVDPVAIREVVRV